MKKIIPFFLIVSAFVVGADVLVKESFEAVENPGVTYASPDDFYIGVNDFWIRTTDTFTVDYPIMPDNFDGDYAYFGEDINNSVVPPGPTDNVARVYIATQSIVGWSNLTANLLIQTGGTDYETLDRISLYASTNGAVWTGFFIGEAKGVNPNEDVVYKDGDTNLTASSTNFVKFSWDLTPDAAVTSVAAVIEVQNSVSTEGFAIDAFSIEGDPPPAPPAFVRQRYLDTIVIDNKRIILGVFQ